MKNKRLSDELRIRPLSVEDAPSFAAQIGRNLKTSGLGDTPIFAGNGPARRLYEACGFVECGRTVDPFRIDGHSVDDIQMVLELDQLR